MNHYRVVFGDITRDRRSDASYSHASCRRRDGHWVVRFHRTEAAARRAAGRYGSVKPVEVVHRAPRGRTFAPVPDERAHLAHQRALAHHPGLSVANVLRYGD